MKSTLGTKAQDGFDFGFNMDGAELYTFQFSPPSTSVGGAASSIGGSALTVGGPASDLDNPVEIPRSALTGEAVEALDAQSGPTASFSMVTGGITINLLFDAAAMAAPASFRAGIQQAASILTATISDKITVNINVDYSGTGGGAAAGPSGGQYLSYSTVRADLINNATAGDATFNALPGGSSIQGQSSVAVWNAQLKLWGVLGANDTTTADGSATFATDIDPNLLVGVALHELTHAMGRVPYGPAPDVMDLFRFSSAGVRMFNGASTAPAAYFSTDGGNTKLADYGQNSDPADFLNSGVQGGNDPFNEYYGGGTLQSLTTADKQQLDALGFHTLTPPTTVIEAFGSTSLVEVGSYYYLDSISNGSGQELKYGGAPVVAGQFGAWTEIGAEVTGSGYEVALKIPGADQYSVWFTDSSGNYVSTAVNSVSGSSAAFESFETSFHQDLNGDGVIGPVGTTIEAVGSTSMVEVGNNFFLNSISSGSGPELKYGGAAVVAGQFGTTWAPIGAETTATGYEVAWKDASTGLYTAWNTDNNGNYVSSVSGLTSYVSGTSYALESLETSLHQDLNGDGQIGLVTSAIETQGATDLTHVADHYFIYNSLGSGPSLKYGGLDVTAGQFGATWAPIGAETTATGYEVAWKDASTGLYTAWNTDNNGNYVSSVSGLTSYVSGTSYALESLETSLHQDLNGDGQIGLVTSAIETQGATDLTHVADHYFLYNSLGSGPSLKFGGMDVTAGQFGTTWAPIGAETTATGYEVAWKDASDGLYTAWNTDNNGNFVSSVSGLTSYVSGTSYALESLETSLHQDLNGDGAVGQFATVLDGHLGGQTLTSSGVGPTALIGGPNDILNAGAGPDTFVFRSSFGSNTVNGFAPGPDSIQFDHAVFADMGAVQSHMQQIGSDVVIAEDAQNLVTLHNVLLSNLHASDFQFV